MSDEFRLYFDFVDYHVYVYAFTFEDLYDLIRKNQGFRELRIVHFKD